MLKRILAVMIVMSSVMALVIIGMSAQLVLAAEKPLSPGKQKSPDTGSKVSEGDVAISDIYLDKACGLHIKYENVGGSRALGTMEFSIFVNGKLAKNPLPKYELSLDSKATAECDPHLTISGTASVAVEIIIPNGVDKKNNNSMTKTLTCPAKQVYVTSCKEEIIADARISEDFIKSTGAISLNYNQVKLHVYSSEPKGDVFWCQYGSGNSATPNTIFNLVYSYACKNAVKGGTSYPHSFTCECATPPNPGQPAPCPPPTPGFSLYTERLNAI